MGIIRIKKEKNFSIMSNIHLNDSSLTLKAKGLLSHLLSNPDDWNVYIKHLIKQSKDGKDSHYAALKVLIKAGYIEKKEVRNKKGQIIGTEYLIREIASKPDTDLPHPENPDMVNQYPENQIQLNTDTTKNRFKQKTDDDKEQNESSFFFEDVCLKFDTHAIRSVIEKHLKTKSVKKVKEAIAYATANNKEENPQSFKSYLDKIILNNWSDGFSENLKKKADEHEMHQRAELEKYRSMIDEDLNFAYKNKESGAIQIWNEGRGQKILEKERFQNEENLMLDKVIKNLLETDSLNFITFIKSKISVRNSVEMNRYNRWAGKIESMKKLPQDSMIIKNIHRKHVTEYLNQIK